MALGKIDFYPLKKQWGYETQFSDWLAEDGLSMIGDAIGIECGSCTYLLAMTIKGKDLLGVEIYSPNDKEQFAKFESARAAIEKELGFKMDWQLLPDKKASRIYFATKLNWLDSTHRKECFVWLSEKAVALKKVFGQSA